MVNAGAAGRRGRAHRDRRQVRQGRPRRRHRKTLVLYDTTGAVRLARRGVRDPDGEPELALRLLDRARRSANYTAGELAAYTAVVYLGSTYDEPLPTAFLDDVTATTKPVIWMYDNIWQLTARDADFAAKHGFTWKQFDFAAVAKVNYKGRTLTRDTADNGAGIMDHVDHRPDQGDRGRRPRSAPTARRSRGRSGRATSPTSARSRSRT